MSGFNDFSTTASSNASVGAINFSEGQLPSTVNNSARQLMADLRYEQGSISSTFSAGASTDLGSFQEGTVVLSGNATISSFGSTATAGLRRKVRVTGTPTIAHSVGAITCPGSANITCAAGDTFEAICEGTNQWRVWNFQRASGAAISSTAYAPTDASYIVVGSNGTLSAERVLTAGSNINITDSSTAGTITVAASIPPVTSVVKQIVAATPYTANSDLTTAMNLDDTIPQNTEGTQILAVSLGALSSSSNKVALSFQGEVGGSVSTTQTMFAIFRNGVADAIASGYINHVGSTGTGHGVKLECVDAPGGTGPYWYSVRIGPNAGTIRMNGSTSARIGGGSMGATLIAMEF